MNQLIKITTNEDDEQLVSARELHKELEIKTRFSQWVTQNFKPFRENVDFSSVVTTTQQNQYGGLRELQDYAVSIEMAKHISMMTGTPKGFEIRDYFIQADKAWNNPEMVVQRALQIQQRKIESLEIENQKKQIQLDEQLPQVVFAKTVEVSKNAVAVKVLATILKQNGVNIGQNRMFQWLREHKYLSSRSGKTWNMPTQKSMDKGLFELKPNTYFHNNGVPETNYTPLVTGKGQIYFVNKFKNEFLFEVAR